MRRISFNGQGNADSAIGPGERPSLSSDGTWVVFTTSASNLTSPRATGSSNVVARNIVTGMTIDFAAPANFGVGSQAVVSPDALGRYVAFFSSASLDRRFAKSGIFVHDRLTHCLMNWVEGVVPTLVSPPTGPGTTAAALHLPVLPRLGRVPGHRQ
jgi:Tol biopolymer transport system component